MDAIRHFTIGTVVLATALLAPTDATSRRFTYTYGSGVLDVSEIEFESWTTVRAQQEDFYQRFDQRMEFEVGLTQKLQTAWYLNFTAVSQDVAPDARETEFEWGGVSNEWKYKLYDLVADPVGMALYFEWGLAPTEAELEFRLILDKRAGNFLTAFNAAVEPEWDYESPETERMVDVEFDLAAAYFLSQEFSLGAEMRNHNDWIQDEGYTHSALFLGPVVSYAGEGWDATLTVLPQIAKLKGGDADAGNNLVLSGHEKLEVRFMFGVELR
jgi:hypothetical protein